ncbi:MAG: hypothetical protein HY721_02860 [Planctomycetes bacterium]|nr:hypothetical protein [Planctomycetota bacterium]
MGLDIAILDETGKPQEGVSLSVEEHWALVQQAALLGLSLWNRMSDYYDDADYDRGEVLLLAEETVQLQRSIHDANLLGKLNQIENLLRMAISRHNSVSAIAD